jgi:hypothetical protein
MALYTPPATPATAPKNHPQIFTVHIALPLNTKKTQKTAGTVAMFLWYLCWAVVVVVVVAVTMVTVAIGSSSDEGSGG